MKNITYIIVAFAGLVAICSGSSVDSIEDESETRAGTGTGNGNGDTKHSRVVWIGSGNQFGDSTGPSGNSSNPDPGNPPPPGVTCTSNGYIPDPDSISSFYICKFNAATGKYDTTKENCSPGLKFQPSPPRCVI